MHVKIRPDLEHLEVAGASASRAGEVGREGRDLRGEHAFQPVPHSLHTTRSAGVQGSILQYARTIAEAQAGGEVPDAVIVVPPWFSQAARQAVIDAAALVNVKVSESKGMPQLHPACTLPRHTAPALAGVRVNEGMHGNVVRRPVTCQVHAPGPGCRSLL